MEKVVLYIRNHRSGTALAGFAAGLLMASPGLLFALLFKEDLFQRGLVSALLFLSLIAGIYVLLAALGLLIAGFRGFAATGYYGGFTLAGILLVITLHYIDVRIPAPLAIPLVVVPMFLLKVRFDNLLDRLDGSAGPVSDDEQALLSQVIKKLMAMQDDNRWVNQRIRQGVMCSFENHEGSDLYSAINFSLFSSRRVVHHSMTRCLVIRLVFKSDAEMVPHRIARRFHELAARVHKKNRSCFAGAIIDASSMTATVFVYYNPRHARSVFQWSLAWSRTVSRDAGVASEKDPAWRHYYEDLSPDEYRYFRVSNQRFYLYLEKRKFDFNQEADLWMVLAFSDGEVIRTALDILEQDGFMLQTGPEKDDDRYYIVIRKSMRLGLERLNQMTDRIISCVHPLGGELIAFDRRESFRRSFPKSKGAGHDRLPS